MKTKVILSTCFILLFGLMSSGFMFNENTFSDDKKNQTECPYFQGKTE